MPDTQVKLPPTEDNVLSYCWVITRLGTRYVFPDMTRQQVDEFRRQLSVETLSSITLRNVSEVVMVLPKRIVAYAGVNHRNFYEAECPTELNPEHREKGS